MMINIIICVAEVGKLCYILLLALIELWAMWNLNCLVHEYCVGNYVLRGGSWKVVLHFIFMIWTVLIICLMVA